MPRTSTVDAVAQRLSIAIPSVMNLVSILLVGRAGLRKRMVCVGVV